MASLGLDALAAPAAVDAAAAKRLFEELCAKFGMDPKVANHLSQVMKLESLEDTVANS